MITITNEEIIQACKNSKSMAEACSKLNMHFNTFARKAKKLGVYITNQSGKNIPRKKSPKIPLLDILNGLHPSFQTNKLRKRLIKEGYKENICEICGCNGIWNNKPLALELHHVDGNRFNHSLENLMIICPNCHTQTKSFRGKNSKKHMGE